MNFWTALIVSQDMDAYVIGRLLIGVQYTDGTTTFSETIDATGSTSDALNSQIQRRLTTLNNNASLISQIQTSVQEATPILSVEALSVQTVQSSVLGVAT